MNKLFLFLFIMFFASLSGFCDTDYEQLYENAQPFGTKLYNDKDPFEDEDALKYAWSPYPLFRTAATLYFKDYTIPPGYYILTPRKLQGKYYVLFKENGKVSYIVPVAKKEMTPLNFYAANTPKVKQTAWQKMTGKVRKTFYSTVAKDSMRVQPPKSLVDVEATTNLVIVKLFYGEDKYTLVFKRTPY